MHVWRLSREQHAATAFSGEGARLFAARWNSVGTPMVYTATSVALAALEVFVHLQRDQAPDDLVLIEANVQVDETQLEQQARELIVNLLPNWRSLEQTATRWVGDEWIKSERSLALKVPSAVIDGEWNVLINPLHPDTAKVSVVQVQPFRFDERMFKPR